MNRAVLSSMAPRDIVIVGAGGFGRETLMLLRDVERSQTGSWNFLGFIDDGQPDRVALNRIGAYFLGPLSDVTRSSLSDSCAFVVGIGGGSARARCQAELMERGMEPVSLIHPNAVLGDDIHIGSGSVICAGSIITTNVHIGEGSQINLSCTIGHDVTLGDFVTLSPAVNIGGEACVDDFASLYTGAAILPRVRIGYGSVVGAGAVVNRDVEARATVVGVPAGPLPPN